MNQDLNSKLKQEIDALNSTNGLMELLRSYGKVYVVGSYVYDVMAWRDFDIVLELPSLETKKVYQIVQLIGEKINPAKLKVMNNLERLEKNRPTGVWVGIYIDSWKIDLWIMDCENAAKEVAGTATISKMLSNIDKNQLVELKAELSNDPNYHAKFSSVDLYRAYVNDDVRTTDEFYEWVENGTAQ